MESCLTKGILKKQLVAYLLRSQSDRGSILQEAMAHYIISNCSCKTGIANTGGNIK